ncbi:hypothetical protein ACIOEW_36190 [Streptomyces sp. NPDC087901]|uniref:hypothetical protein n=1 Tax=Streptomyces sp. NPDC087901 TaxID=3365818 RepID=UPI0037FE7C73
MSIDGLCRLCLITLRSQGRAPDFDDALGPEDIQLMVHVSVGRLGLALPLSRGGVRPRSQRRNVKAGRRARPHLDDQTVIPAAVPGQGILLPAQRTVDALHLTRIRDRTWPEWPRLAALAAEIAGERRVSDSWRRMVLRLVRAALSMRDADGARLVAEEYFEQLPKNGTGGAVEVLRRAGLLMPRSQPKSRWPTRSCGHCGCWGVTKGLCRGCESWKHEPIRYPVAGCARCTRTLPLSRAAGLCRGCLIHVREHGPDTPGHTQLQLALGKRPVTQLKHPARFLGYDTTATTHRTRARERARRRPAPRPVSEHLVDPQQGALFPAMRDWSRLASFTADELPALTPNAERLLDGFTRFCRAQLRFTDPNPHGHAAALRALRIVLAHLGAAAPVHEADLRDLARLDPNISAQRVIGFLTQLGHLVPALTVDHDQAAINRLTASFPDPMRTELQHWVTVLKGEGRRRHQPLPTATIRGYLWQAAPIVRMWSEHTTTLTAITQQDIHDILTRAPGKPARSAHHVLRSLFGALKQQRVVFRDPTRGIHLPANPPLPRPLPSDRLAGLLDRAHTPLARLLVALTAIHAVLPSQAAAIPLRDLDLANGRLRLPSRTLYLDSLTTELLCTWLTHRQNTWPVCANPHLLVSAQTALDPTGPPIGKTLLRNAIGRTGLTARALWQDRILAEARHSADPVRLIRLFAIADSTAMRYVQAAHPEKTGRLHP